MTAAPATKDPCISDIRSYTIYNPKLTPAKPIPATPPVNPRAITATMTAAQATITSNPAACSTAPRGDAWRCPLPGELIRRQLATVIVTPATHGSITSNIGSCTSYPAGQAATSTAVPPTCTPTTTAATATAAQHLQKHITHHKTFDTQYTHNTYTTHHTRHTTRNTQRART